MSPSHHKISKHDYPHEQIGVKPPKFLGFKFKLRQVYYSSQSNQGTDHLVFQMMRKTIGNCIGHNLKEDKSPKTFDFMCIACATEKLILRYSPLKIHIEPLKFVEGIQRDICGPIPPSCGPFRYLIDASYRLSHVCLLLMWNHVFAKIMV
jgi:hypothetical protein